MTKLFQKYFSLKNGIWYSSEPKNISYDPEGNSNCFEIEDTSYWFKHRRDCIDILINKYCKNFGSFADIGGGNGFLTLHLQNNRFDAVLIEPAYEAVNNAKTRGVKNIICANIEDFNKTEIKFDYAGVFDVLEHVKNNKEFLNSISNTMNKGGKLFITVPAFNILWSREDDLIGHQRRYTKKILCRELECLGFVKLRTAYFFSFLFLPVFFLRTIPTKFKFIKSNQSEMKDNYEYSVKNKFVSFILKCFTSAELFAIKKNLYIPFGSSILAVFEKK